MLQKQSVFNFCTKLCLYLDSNCLISGGLVKHLLPFFAGFNGTCNYWQSGTCYFTANDTILEQNVISRFITCVTTIIENKGFATFHVLHFDLQGLNKHIPSCNIVFCDSVMTYDITFFGWYKKQKQPIFDVDTLCWTSSGIQVLDQSKDSSSINLSREQTFFSLANNILNKTARFVDDVEQLQYKAFPTKSVPLIYKQKCLQTLYNIISTPYLHIQEEGFEVIGKKPSILFEISEDCPITGAKPVYPCFVLQCNHAISFMAYRGLIHATQEDTESLRCPFCRADLKIRFLDEVKSNKPTTITTWKNMGKSKPKWKSKWIHEDF